MCKASKIEEPCAVVPHAGICEGVVRATGDSTSITCATLPTVDYSISHGFRCFRVSKALAIKEPKSVGRNNIFEWKQSASYPKFDYLRKYKARIFKLVVIQKISGAKAVSLCANLKL